MPFPMKINMGCMMEPVHSKKQSQKVSKPRPCPPAQQAAVGPGGTAGSTRCLWMEVSEGSWESDLFAASGCLVYASFQDFLSASG